MSDIDTLARVLKQAREIRMLSLREVEVASGVSNAYISQLENGKITKPSVFYVSKLAKAYEIDLTDLFAAAGCIGYKQDVDKSIKRLGLSMLLNLTVDEVQEVVKFAQFIVSRRD